MLFIMREIRGKKQVQSYTYNDTIYIKNSLNRLFYFIHSILYGLIYKYK